MHYKQVYISKKKITTLIVFLLIIPFFGSCKKNDKKQNLNRRHPVIITTDAAAEIDDQWMLVHLLGMDNIEILGIFSSHFGDRTGKNESQLSKNIIDVIIDLTGHAPEISFMGNNKKLTEISEDQVADKLYDLIKDYSSDNRVKVVLSGPATDIALLLSKFPNSQHKIEIFATAFYSRKIGSSYNVHNDLEAWQVILDSDCPITVSPNQVSKSSFIKNIKDLNNITNSTNSLISTYLESNTNLWMSNNKEIILQVTGDENIWPIWDLILPAALSGYCETEATVRPILLDNGYLNYSGADKNKKINWIISCDSTSTWKDFLGIIQ